MYNKMVSDRLKGYDREMAKRLEVENISSNNELLRGGTRPRKHVMVGTDSSTFAPSFNAPEKLVGVSGGNKASNFAKGFAKGFGDGFMGVVQPAAEVAKVVAPIMLKAAGKSELDKAKDSLQKYVEGKKKSKPLKKHLDLLEQQGIISKTQEGGVNRLKKAKRWTGFAVDTANKGLDLAEKGMKIGSAKKPSLWIEHVKKVAASQGIPYNQALKIAGASYNK